MGINTYLVDFYCESIRRKAFIESVLDIHWTIIIILFEFIENSCIVFHSVAGATVTWTVSLCLQVLACLCRELWRCLILMQTPCTGRERRLLHCNSFT